MKTTPSKAARAAAVMAFTSNVTSYEEALAVYDWLVSSERGSLEEAFPEICWWYPAPDTDDTGDWANIITDLASTFDSAVRHFKA